MQLQIIKAVLTAVNRGINFIDTAPLYMESERRIGIAHRRAQGSIGQRACREDAGYGGQGAAKGGQESTREQR